MTRHIPPVDSLVLALRVRQECDSTTEADRRCILEEVEQDAWRYVMEAVPGALTDD